tara:strand:- start:379 stop:1281 length:903 start_codon:yes stop_codon:yes gene_type:complete
VGTEYVGISGSSGFIGKQLSGYLRTCGIKVVCFSRSEKDSDNSFARHFDMAEASEDYVDLSGIGSFIHLAGAAHGKYGEDTGTIELLGLTRLLRNCVTANVRHFIYVSSAAVYGKSYSKVPILAHSIPTPISDYGISKLRCENLVKKVCMDNGITFSILRLPLVLGVGAPGNLRLLEKIVVSGVPLPFKSLKNKRSVLWLDQLCHFVLIQTYEKQLCNKTVFLCNGVPLSLPQIITWIGMVRSFMPRLFGRWDFPVFLKNTLFFGKIIGDLEFSGEDYPYSDPGYACQDLAVFLCETSST